MTTEKGSLIQARRPRLRYVALTVLLAVVAVGYWWHHERRWTLKGPDGRSLCRVQAGWTEREVASHCGARSGRGWQPKVAAFSSGVSNFQMCSAPGDVYGKKAVLYGCDGKVETVESMPAHGFIYPSD